MDIIAFELAPNIQVINRALYSTQLLLEQNNISDNAHESKVEINRIKL